MKDLEEFVVFFLRNGSLSTEEIIKKFIRFGFTKDEALKGIRISQEKNMIIFENDILTKI